MSIESPRPPQEAEQQHPAEMIAPTAPPEQLPAAVTPTGEPGGQHELGKPRPARKGRTVARRKPEKKRPARAGEKRAAARRKTARPGSKLREKEGWRTEPKVGGRKPSASQKKGPTKKAAPARKTLAKRTAAKTAKAPRRAPATKRGAPAARRTTKRATSRR